MICAVFAVAAVETFVYELGEEAFRSEDKVHGEFFRGLGKLVRDMEESRFQLPVKLDWIARYLTGKRARGESGAFQDFEILVRLRNTIIHLKDSEETCWYEDGSIDVKGTPKIVDQLQSKGVIPPDYMPSWIVAISDRKVAEWSCETAIRLVEALLGMLPTSELKRFMEIPHAAFRR